MDCGGGYRQELHRSPYAAAVSKNNCTDAEIEARRKGSMGCCRMPVFHGTGNTPGSCPGGGIKNRTTCGFRKSCFSRRGWRRSKSTIPAFLDAFSDGAGPGAGRGRALDEAVGRVGLYSRAAIYRRRQRKLWRILRGGSRKNYDDILSLPGVGAYTAGAISSICFEQPAPAVDGNVLRVIARIMEDYEDIGTPQMKAKITAALQSVYPAGQCGDFTQSLMELGATVCLPDGQPLCGQCPAARFCRAHKNGTELDLPVKAKKKARRIEEKNGVFTAVRQLDGCLQTGGQRPAGGALQFPNVPGGIDGGAGDCPM